MISSIISNQLFFLKGKETFGAYKDYIELNLLNRRVKEEIKRHHVSVSFFLDINWPKGLVENCINLNSEVYLKTEFGLYLTYEQKMNDPSGIFRDDRNEDLILKSQTLRYMNKETLYSLFTLIQRSYKWGEEKSTSYEEHESKMIKSIDNKYAIILSDYEKSQNYSDPYMLTLFYYH